MKRILSTLTVATFMALVAASPALAGNLEATPDGGVAGDPVVFPDTSVGGTSTINVELDKSTGSPISITTVSITGTDAANFAIDPVTDDCTGDTTKCSVDIDFNPDDERAFSATLSIEHNGDNASPLEVPLSGNGADLCGNEVVDEGETCDDGELNSDTEPDACRTNCQEAACGDGVVDPNGADGAETCDDQNEITTDCCDACTLMTGGEACEEEGGCLTGGTCDGEGVCTGADTPVADDTPCDDADACTLTDACSSGVCVGSDDVDCTATEECHDDGVCDPATGECSDPLSELGAECDDGNPDNGTDACDGAGECVGGLNEGCSLIMTAAPITAGSGLFLLVGTLVGILSLRKRG